MEWRAASATSCLCQLVNKGSEPTKSALACCSTRAAKAVSMLLSVLAFRGKICSSEGARGILHLSQLGPGAWICWVHQHGDHFGLWQQIAQQSEFLRIQPGEK